MIRAMSRHLTRRLLAIFAGLLAVPLLGLSVAWACTALATIDMDHKEGAVVGDVVKGTGNGFDATSPNQVEIRLSGREGPVLDTATPGPTGAIAFEFTTPQAAPGDYVIVATQLDATGQPVGGTPARAPFKVVGAEPAPAQGQPAAPPQQQPQPAQPAPAQAVPAQPAPAAPAQPAPAQAVAPEQGPPAPEQAVPAQPAPPAPAAPAPADAVAPAPAPAQAPAVAGERSVMMAPDAQSLALPLIMVAVGLLLTVGSGALVLASRRPADAEATARR